MAIYNLIYGGRGGGGITPSGTISISANGTYDVTDFASASVSVTPNIQSLTVTENGTYTPSGAVDGYGPVTVNVSGGGGDENIIKKWAEQTPLTLEDSTVAFVASSAFLSQKGITSVSFPNASYVGSSAFCECGSLKTINIASAVTIGPGAFRKCTKLSSVGELNALTTILSSGFFECSSLQRISASRLTSLGESAFYNCWALTEAYFPSIASIGNAAFAGCSYLNSFDATGLSTVSPYTFSKCYSITTLSLPKVTSIGTGAFSSCTRLVSLYLMGSSVPTIATNVFYSTPIGGYSTSARQFGSVFVPSSLWAQYQTATNWSSIASRIVSM